MSQNLLVQQIPQSDETQFSELMDRSFQVPAGQSYLKDFPVWRGSTPEILKMGAYDGNKLVGSACVRVADLWGQNSKQLLVGLIGAVATEKDYRGRGIAKRLVSLASDWAQNRGASLSVLWGSEHELYAKIGFFPCGQQVRVPLSGLQIKSDIGTVQQGWNPAILRSLQSRKSGISLQKLDGLWLSAQENVQWFWTGSQNSPSAYAAIGRGIDLHHIVHEWGGEMKELFRLLSAVNQVDSQAELLGSPEIFQKAGIQFDPSSVEYLCLAKILDPSVIVRAFTHQASVTSKFGNDLWTIRFENEASLEASAPELTRIFFGPVVPGARLLGSPWSKTFPLPLWFWGLDAV